MPLGAAAKEYGPQLKLSNDWTLAEYLKRHVLDACDVVVALTVGYHCYPAFAEYPGSLSLRLATARNLIVDICTSLAVFGPRRFVRQARRAPGEVEHCALCLYNPAFPSGRISHDLQT
jgi:creatinine amidohydrolase